MDQNLGIQYILSILIPILKAIFERFSLAKYQPYCKQINIFFTILITVLDVHISFSGLEDHYLADDDLPYATLSYANGPGARHMASSFQKHGARENLTSVDTGKNA